MIWCQLEGGCETQASSLVVASTLGLVGLPASSLLAVVLLLGLTTDSQVFKPTQVSKMEMLVLLRSLFKNGIIMVTR